MVTYLSVVIRASFSYSFGAVAVAVAVGGKSSETMVVKMGEEEGRGVKPIEPTILFSKRRPHVANWITPETGAEGL